MPGADELSTNRVGWRGQQATAIKTKTFLITLTVCLGCIALSGGIYISVFLSVFTFYKLIDTSSGTVVTVSAMFRAEILNFLAKQNLQKGMSSSSPNTLSTFFGPEKYKIIVV